MFMSDGVWGGVEGPCTVTAPMTSHPPLYLSITPFPTFSSRSPVIVNTVEIRPRISTRANIWLVGWDEVGCVRTGRLADVLRAHAGDAG